MIEPIIDVELEKVIKSIAASCLVHYVKCKDGNALLDAPKDEEVIIEYRNNPILRMFCHLFTAATLEVVGIYKDKKKIQQYIKELAKSEGINIKIY